MTLQFKPTVWKAGDRFVMATITKGDDGFYWEVFSKVDAAVITDGSSRSLSDARRRCQEVALVVRDAES